MDNCVSEAERIEQCLAGIAKASVWLERVVRVVGAFVSVCLVAVSVVGIYSYYSPTSTMSLTIGQSVSLLPCGLMVAAISFFTWRLADLLAKGQSPFTQKAYRSVVGIAASLAVFGVLELYLYQYGLGGLVDPLQGVTLISGSPLAFASLLGAGVVGVLAYVFRYGMLLQQQSEYLI